MPAEAAGLRRGDLLLAAGGAPLGELDIPGVRDAIAGVAGTQLTLLVRRAASETEIIVDRIERPDDATIAGLRDEAELQAAPAHQRAAPWGGFARQRAPRPRGVLDFSSQKCFGKFFTPYGERV